MRALHATLLALVTAALVTPAVSQAGVQRSHRGVTWSDEAQRFSVRFPLEWDEVEPRMVRELLDEDDIWPETTAVLYLNLDRERYTCPCVWVARVPNADLPMDLLADLSAEVYETAALERLVGGDRVPPLNEDRYNFFHDPERDMVWSWADREDGDGDRWRAASVYVPTTEGTMVMLYTATPNMFDFYVPKVIDIIDTAEVHWTRLEELNRAVQDALDDPASLSSPESQGVLAVPAAVVLAAVLGIGGLGWRARGAGFALRCALMTVGAVIGLLALLPEIVRYVRI